MIDLIRIKNIYTNAEATLGKKKGYTYVLETDGISWGETDATHNSYTNLTGVGDIITSTKLNTRSISITGRICPPLSDYRTAERYELSTEEELEQVKIQEIQDAKEYLSQIINPLHLVRIIVGDYYIEGKPTSSLVISNKWKENNDVFCKFTFTLKCSDPLFHYKTKIDVPLSGVKGGFHFPLHIPLPRGMHFGEKIPYQLITINNPCDISLGGIIYVEANGPVSPFTLTNVHTQESLIVHKTLQVEEIVKIDTINRKITGSTDGGDTWNNYFEYWDFDNAWLQFNVGDSLIGFSTNDDTYKNMNTWIELSWSYYSLGEQ